MKQPYQECPQFNGCNCNVCPLDPEMRNKEVMEGDGVCVAQKPTRLRIGARYPELLPMGGLNYREFRNKSKRDARTHEQVAIISARLEKVRQNAQNKALKGGSHA